MIKISLRQLNLGFPVLLNFSEQGFKNRKMIYDLGRIVDGARPHYQKTQEHWNALVIKHGEEIEVPDGNGGKKKEKSVLPGKDAEFRADWEELLDAEVEFFGSPVDLDQVPEEFLPTANQLSVLVWLFNEPKA